MCEMTGYPRDEIVGTPFRRYFTDPQRADNGIRKVLSEDRARKPALTDVLTC